MLRKKLVLVGRCLHCGRHDDMDEILTTPLHSAQDDIFMRSLRLRYAPLRMTKRMRCIHFGRHDVIWMRSLRLHCVPLRMTTLYNHEVQNPLMCGFHHEVISSCKDFICQSRQISFFVPTKSG